MPRCCVPHACFLSTLGARGFDGKNGTRHAAPRHEAERPDRRRARLHSTPMRYAMIMAGGAGTRLWPMSRGNKPKQLLKFIEEPGVAEPRSLLEIAAQRLEGLIDPA